MVFKAAPAVKSIVYRVLANVQEARKLFEANDATHYADYKKLRCVFRDSWDAWKAFITENTVTSGFLSDAAIFNDLSSIIRLMNTPENASRESYDQMRNIRSSVLSISRELHAVKVRVDETILLLQ